MTDPNEDVLGSCLSLIVVFALAVGITVGGNIVTRRSLNWSDSVSSRLATVEAILTTPTPEAVP